MKMNMNVFKKGKPIYWVIGGLVIFVLFYLMFNRGASSGSVTAVSSGPSDAAIAASTQLAMAQTNASAGVAVAQLQANSQLAQIQAGADVAKYTAGLDATTAANYLTTQKELAAIQGEYTLDTAKVAAETSIAQYQINANVLNTQMATNAAMFEAAQRTVVAQTALSVVPSLDYRTRSQALVATLGELNNKNVVWTPGAGNNVSVSG